MMINLAPTLAQHSKFIIWAPTTPPKHYVPERGQYWYDATTDTLWSYDTGGVPYGRCEWHIYTGKWREYGDDPIWQKVLDEMRIVREIMGYDTEAEGCAAEGRGYKEGDKEIV